MPQQYSVQEAIQEGNEESPDEDVQSHLNYLANMLRAKDDTNFTSRIGMTMVTMTDVENI